MWTVLTKLQGLLNMDGGYSHLKIICIHFQIIWKWTQLALSHKPWGESPWSGTAGFAQPGPQTPVVLSNGNPLSFWELLRTAAIVYFTPEVQWESQRITTRLCGTFHVFAVSWVLHASIWCHPCTESKSKTETLPLLTVTSWAPTKRCLCTNTCDDLLCASAQQERSCNKPWSYRLLSRQMSWMAN